MNLSVSHLTQEPFIPQSLLDANNENEPRLTLIAGDASDRKFYRLQKGGESLICMRFPKWEGGYGGDPLSWLGMQKALQEIGIPVPKVFLVDEENAAIWTEDFGDSFLNAEIPNGSLDINDPACERALAFYYQALDLLITAQYPMTPIRPHPAQELAFDKEKLLFEMHFFVTHFLEAFLGLDEHTLPVSKQALEEEFIGLCSFLSGCERVLCHRDYHVRNVMMVGDELRWIDFQDARMGPHTYDVVSLVRDSYVRITPATRLKLYQYYLTKVNLARQAQNLPMILPSEFEKEAWHMGLQRNIKAIGSFGYLATTKGKPGYLHYVNNTLATLLESTSFASSSKEMIEFFPTIFALLQNLNDGDLAAKLHSRQEQMLQSKSLKE